MITLTGHKALDAKSFLVALQFSRLYKVVYNVEDVSQLSKLLLEWVTCVRASGYTRVRKRREFRTSRRKATSPSSVYILQLCRNYRLCMLSFKYQSRALSQVSAPSKIFALQEVEEIIPNN